MQIDYDLEPVFRTTLQNYAIQFITNIAFIVFIINPLLISYYSIITLNLVMPLMLFFVPCIINWVS